MKSALRVSLIVGLMSLFAASQSPNATVTGRVLDPNSAVIADANVDAINLLTNIHSTGQTNREGSFVIPNLPPGPYRIEISRSGFKTAIREDVVLRVQDVIALNFTLPIGSVTETVTVTGGAPLVNTQDASVSTVVDRQFIENLPMNGRSFQTLIQLTPGVVVTQATFASQGQFSVNGQRADANYFSVDGTSANIGITASGAQPEAASGSLPGLSALGGTNNLVSVDAMQEFRIQTSTFAPEFGRTPGAQLSIVTRSGSNMFHGTLFDYLRNDVFDANNWFADHNSLPKPKERQNDFGGVLGGPIVKDRTFFFFSYEGLRLRQPVTAVSLVPSLASRSAAPAAVQPFLNAFPMPNGANLANGLAQFAASYSNPGTLDAYSLRVDHTITSKLLLFGRYNYSPSKTAQRGTVLSSQPTVSVTTHTMTVGLTANISSRMSDEFRANYSNQKATNIGHLDNLGGAVPLTDDILFPAGSPGSSAASRLFSLSITGAGTGGSSSGNLQLGPNASSEQRQFNVTNGLTIVTGSHQLKLGVDYRWLSPITDQPAYEQTLQFSGVTAAAGSALSGIASSSSILANQGVSLLSRNFSLYGQDTWRAGDRLTLTYGLRWDIDPALTGKNSASDPVTFQSLSNPLTLSLAPSGTPLYNTTYGNVAPRVGISYQARETRGWESVLHAGFGTFYDFASGFLGELTSGYQFAGRKNLLAVPLPLTAQQLAPPLVGQLPASLTYVADRQLKLPRTYQWSVAAEQSLGSNQILSATYLGAIGRDLLRNDILENATFGQVTVTRNTATSDYHALQLKFQRKLSRGLQALASYTWSHSIDISSNDSFASSTPGTISAPGVDRGNSEFDIRHSATGALTYDIPFHSSSRLARWLLADWSTDSLFMARSAPPVDLIGTFFIINNTFFTARPSVVPGMPFYLYGPQYPGGKALNRAAFTLPLNGQQGDLGRNQLRGFGAWQDNWAVRRQFHLTENVGLQFRAEFFNIFNHPNFGPPANTITGVTFGQSSQILASSLGSGGSQGGFAPLYQIGGPRSTQLAIKMQF